MTFYLLPAAGRLSLGRLMVGLACCLCWAPFGQAAPPNVLVILADDAGWGDFSFVGNTNLATPAIDSLARGGATLSRFFVQPVCAPTRASCRWIPNCPMASRGCGSACGGATSG